MNKGKEFLSSLKLHSDYLKYKAEVGRYEKWEEACEDVLLAHEKKYGKKVINYVEEALPYYKNKQVLASQRCLQFRYDSLLKHNTKLYNCSVLYMYSPDAFKKGFYVLLSGCGLGVNLKQKYLQGLPNIVKRSDKTVTFVIPDSIEGWSEAIHCLVSSYCKHPSLQKEYYGKNIRFDYSQIRPKGATISGAFLAPGPDGLKQSLERIETFIEARLGSKEEIAFSSYVCYNIWMHICDAVLSGNLRRSAMNIIIDKEDKEMLYAKTGNWRVDNPHFARSNNSVGIMKGSFSKKQFKELLDLNEGDNDIGFVFLESEDQMFNPCVTGDTKVLTKLGYFRIDTLLDKPVEIWNGFEWSEVIPKITGYNQPMLKITLSDGRSLTCTTYHNWILSKNYRGDSIKKKAKDLKIGDKLIKYNFPIVDIFTDSISEKHAYTQGFISADGMDDYDFLHLYDTKYSCIDKLDVKKEGNEFKTFTETTRKKIEFNDKYENKSFVPFSWSVKSKLNWLSGLLDGDGCELKEGGCQLVSTNINFLTNLQKILTLLGVNSKIVDASEKTYRSLPDGKGGVKDYLCQESKRICIGATEIQQLKELGLNCSRLTFNKNPNRNAGQFVKVVKIEDAGIEEKVYCFNEPIRHYGVFNGILTGQCFEISFDFFNKIKNYNDTVIQFCNLTEINASSSIKKDGSFDEEMFYKQCRATSIIGTLQAGWTSFPFLGEQTEEMVKGEALLGVSVTGWMNNPSLFNPDVLKKGARIVRETNAEVADVIGINHAARTTTCKPSGNASVILGTASGIHPEHSERYFRVMQMNKTSEMSKWLKEHMSELLEESAWSAGNTDYVVYVPIENGSGGKYKDDLNDIEHLEYIKLVQEHWVWEGSNDSTSYSPGTHHNVSNTVLIDDKEKITDYIYDNQKFFGAVSFLSRYGDKDFTQAPFTSVLSTREIIDKYGENALFASGTIVDGIHYFGDLWTACTSVEDKTIQLTGGRDQVLLKQDWIRRVKKFAKNYMKGNLKETIYLLKDVHLAHKWKVVNRVFTNVPDFNSILPPPSYIDVSTLGAIACSGGGCEITAL